MVPGEAVQGLGVCWRNPDVSPWVLRDGDADRWADREPEAGAAEKGGWRVGGRLESAATHQDDGRVGEEELDTVLVSELDPLQVVLAEVLARLGGGGPSRAGQVPGARQSWSR